MTITDKVFLIINSCFLPTLVSLAALIPKLDLFISLVGAVSSSILALVFPPMLEMVTFWSQTTKWLIIKNALITVFGVLVFATGTYASIAALVTEFSK